MYALLTESKQAIQHYEISGTIDSLSFDDENVLKGSLSVNNQCSASNEFRLGGAYIGQLNITLMGVNISRNSWEGKEIAPIVTIGNTDIPLGVFNIDTATHSRGMVAIKAYDNMAKFDKTFGLSAGVSGKPYDLLVTACEECGVNFGMSQADVQALPNGNLELFLLEIGDIETWRDFIYWIAVSVCSFATIDRSGNLVVRKFHSTVDDTIDSNVRYQGSSYADEIIRYTGVNVFVSADSTVEYYHAETDDGYTLNIGNNPLFQTTKAQRQIYVNNIVNALSEIQFVSGSVKIPFGFQYDLGDVLQFPNGQGSSTNLFCMMGYSFKYNGECTLIGIAGQKNSKSKTDKNLQGLLTTVSKNEFTSYEWINTSEITITDNQRERIIHIPRIASNTSTKAQIHIEVNLESEADEDYTQGVVSYVINSEEVEFHPTETWIDGNHVLHLMYILPLDANSIHQFDVYLKSLGGTITIPRRGIWFYASGAGLVGDGKWDGTITLEDDVTPWSITNVTFANVTDSVTVATQVPIVGGNLSDTASGWTIPVITFESASDSMYIEMHTDVFRRVTEDGSIRTTEDGDVRYTEGD